MSPIKVNAGDLLRMKVAFGARRLGERGHDHRQVRNVTTGVEVRRWVFSKNQHVFPTLQWQYAWSFSNRIINNREFNPDYI